MAEKPWKLPKACTKIFRLIKGPEFCEMIGEDIFYRQKKCSGSHQKGNFVNIHKSIGGSIIFFSTDFLIRYVNLKLQMDSICNGYV